MGNVLARMGRLQNQQQIYNPVLDEPIPPLVYDQEDNTGFVHGETLVLHNGHTTYGLEFLIYFNTRILFINVLDTKEHWKIDLFMPPDITKGRFINILRALLNFHGICIYHRQRCVLLHCPVSTHTAGDRLTPMVLTGELPPMLDTRL